MSHLNRYSSIVPENMTSRELGHLIVDLTTAINWNKSYANVDVATGIDKEGNTTYTEYKVEVDRLPDYQRVHRPTVL